MLTPRDILDIKFDNSIRGYSQRQVDKFMSRVVSEYETLYNERNTLKKRLKEIEGDAYDEMQKAEHKARDVKRDAQKEAASIISEAEEKAEKILSQLGKEQQEIKEDIETLSRKYEAMKEQIGSLGKELIRLAEDKELVDDDLDYDESDEDDLSQV